MAKPDLPEVLRTPMEDFDEEFALKLNALAEHFGGFEYAEKGRTDWQIVAMNMAMQYVPGFQVGPAPKKRGGQPKRRTAARDFFIACKMTEELERHDIKDEMAAAQAVHQDYPILGKNGEAVRQRWLTLKREKGAFERMKEYAAREHNFPGPDFIR